MAADVPRRAVLRTANVEEAHARAEQLMTRHRMQVVRDDEPFAARIDTDEYDDHIVAHEFAPGQQVYKLVDFGIANIRETDETRLTGPHEFLGTIAYASPEQLSGGTVDERSDIYSMGAVVYEMLTGRQPFTGPDPMAILTAHLTGPIPRVSEVVIGVPAWIDLAIGRALAKDPRDRFTTITDFAHALLAGDGSSTTADSSCRAPATAGG